MPELLSKFPEQLKEFWQNLEKNNRVKLVVMSVLVFISVLIAIIILTRPTYTTLISSIEPNNMKEVLSQLEQSNITYKIDTGNVIKVKKNDLNRAKAALLQEGLPQRGVTLAEYDMTKLGTTDKQRQRMYKEYKERDLAATLREYDNINNALVKLSIPEQNNFFSSEEQKVKASVAIDPNVMLTEKQIKGIEMFISGSVEGLEPENVTIIDNNANILNDGYDETNDYAQNLDKQYILKQEIRKGVEKQVKELLTGTANNVRVMANLELDFDSLVENKEIYEPVIDEEGIITSKAVREEQVINGTTGGSPGTDSNIPTYPNTGEENSNGKYSLTDETYNYEINKTISQYTKEIGKIIKEKSSIAIALYNVIPNNSSEGDNAKTDIPTVETEKIIRMVSSATGIPVDNVVVDIFNIPPPEIKTQHSFDFITLVNTFGPLAVLIFLVILIGFAILRRREDERLQPVEAYAGGAEASNDISIKEEGLADIEFEEKSEVKRKINNFVEKKPEVVAHMLRNWLAEDWE